MYTYRTLFRKIDFYLVLEGKFCFYETSGLSRKNKTCPQARGKNRFYEIKFDTYTSVIIIKSSPYNIFTIIWYPSPALISKCLKRVRFLLLIHLI